jgi:hypothetical protein
MILLKNKDGNIKKFDNISEFGMSFADWNNITNKPEGVEYFLEKAKDKKYTDLDNYHDSEEVRNLTINGIHKINMNSNQRMLLKEQIGLMEDKIKLTELKGKKLDINTLTWNFNIGNNNFISLNYLALIYISTAIMNITNPNFNTKKIHRHNIKELKTIKEVEDYDFKKGYLANQIIKITK